MNENGLNYIDLFAGAGGLSEGFIQSGYRPVAHVEMNEHAAKTIETRIAYYYLKDNGKIKSYYDYEKGKITREQLLEKIPKEELKTVINQEMSESTIKGIFNTIDDIKREKEIDKIDVIIGGPPCQAYSLVGRAQSSHMIVPMEDDNADVGGISKEVCWQGGGGYKFYELAEPLLVKNKVLPVYQINPSYTWDMVCEAICKIEGFTYEPSGEFRGHSSENRFIHITEEFVNTKYVMSIMKNLGDKQSLLIYCKKNQADMILPENVEVKKIPKDLLDKCNFESEVQE